MSKNVGRDLILSIRNWLDTFGFLMLWSHVNVKEEISIQEGWD